MANGQHRAATRPSAGAVRCKGVKVADGKAADVVGRDDELARLTGLLQDAAGGAPRCAVIEGEAGIGKSLLAASVCTRAAESLTVYSARCEELTGERPFHAIGEALGIGSSDALGEVRRLLVEGPDANDLAVDHRYRIGDAIEDVVERAAIKQPVLLAIEDVHWADPGTLLCLALLSRRQDLPIFLLLTRRPLPCPPALTRLLTDLEARGCARIALGPLDEQAIVDLARERVGAEPGPGLRRQLAGAGGNPLFALELLTALEADDLLCVQLGAAETEQPVTPSPSFRALVIRRLSCLSPAGVALLTNAAILGESFAPAELALVTARPVPEVLGLLDEAATAGFVSATGDSYRFRHDLLRDALYADMAVPARKALHLHVGRTLAASGSAAETVAPHFSLGADNGSREAIDWLSTAAREVAPRAADTSAALLQRAADLLPPDSDERMSLLVEALFALAVTGQTAAAERLMERLRATALGPPWPQLVDHMRLFLLILHLRMADAAAVSGALLVDPALPASSRADVAALSACAHASLGEVAVATARVKESRQSAAPGPSVSEALCLSAEGGICWQQGRYADAVPILKDRVVAARPVGGAGESLGLLAAAHVLADDLREAANVLEEARAILERNGRRQFIVEHHWWLAQLHMARGSWDDALAEIETSRLITQETGAVGVRSILADPAPVIHVLRGDTVSARTAVAVIDHEPAPDTPMVRRWLEPTRAIVQSAEGDTREAASTLTAWLDLLDEFDYAADFRTVGRSVVQIARAAGDGRLLERLASAAAVARRRSDSTASVVAATMLVEGAATEDFSALTSAVQTARQCDRRFDLAEACAEAGLHACRDGDSDVGRDLVSQAIGGYDALQASRPAALLAQEARALGIRRGPTGPRRTDLLGWGSLTATERRVVDLVAEGLTNGDIGQRMFVSRGTVATHLRSVFRKLEVSSRAQLAAAAAARKG